MNYYCFVIQVSIGGNNNQQECTVASVENQKILCDIGDMTTTHVITNEDCGTYSPKHISSCQLSVPLIIIIIVIAFDNNFPKV